MTTNTYSTDRAAWDQAAARYTAANVRAKTKGQTDEQLDAAIDEQVASVRALIGMRAPDVAALAFKARAVLEEQAMFADESPDSASTLAMLLDSTRHEALAASVYQDALALSGVTSELVDVQPNGFDAWRWLQGVEAEFGVKLLHNPKLGRAYIFHGERAEEAYGRFMVLTARERSWVTALAPTRAN